MEIGGWRLLDFIIVVVAVFFFFFSGRSFIFIKTLTGWNFVSYFFFFFLNQYNFTISSERRTKTSLKNSFHHWMSPFLCWSTFFHGNWITSCLLILEKLTLLLSAADKCYANAIFFPNTQITYFSFKSSRI